MANSLTRRAVVSAAPAAAVVAASMPALAVGTHPDAELLALREPFDRTWRAYIGALAVDSDNGPIVISTGDANREIAEAMSLISARTIEGLAFKAKVSQEHEDNRFEELVTSIMNDIMAMGGAHA